MRIFRRTCSPTASPAQPPLCLPIFLPSATHGSRRWMAGIGRSRSNSPGAPALDKRKTCGRQSLHTQPIRHRDVAAHMAIAGCCSRSNCSIAIAGRQPASMRSCNSSARRRWPSPLSWVSPSRSTGTCASGPRAVVGAPWHDDSSKAANAAASARRGRERIMVGPSGSGITACHGDARLAVHF